MAHVHGAAAKMAADHHAAMGHGTTGMASMMEHAGGSAHAMAKITQHAGTAAGVAVASSTPVRKGFMSILTRHPLLVFGLGVAAGYYAHKYRKEIIESATLVTEKGKDFVLNQKENLEDLVAECKECADDEASEKGKAKGKA
jgi:hypothetical protein